MIFSFIYGSVVQLYADGLISKTVCVTTFNPCIMHHHKHSGFHFPQFSLLLRSVWPLVILQVSLQTIDSHFRKSLSVLSDFFLRLTVRFFRLLSHMKPFVCCLHLVSRLHVILICLCSHSLQCSKTFDCFPYFRNVFHILSTKDVVPQWDVEEWEMCPVTLFLEVECRLPGRWSREPVIQRTPEKFIL